MDLSRLRMAWRVRRPRDILLSRRTTQVAACRAPPRGRRSRTVDKFQAAAPIVFFSLATSSGENVPRDLTFLFSRTTERGVSRARAWRFSSPSAAIGSRVPHS